MANLNSTSPMGEESKYKAPSVRTTGGITNKEVNPVYKAINTVSSYVGNIGKEIKDNAKAYRNTQEMSNRVGPGTDAEANKLAGKQRKEAGQLAGAVFQGARYDTNGKRITK